MSEFNLLLTCFIAQLVEHHTGTAEDMGSNPIEASDFFLSFLCNCKVHFHFYSLSTVYIAHNPSNLQRYNLPIPLGGTPGTGNSPGLFAQGGTEDGLILPLSVGRGTGVLIRGLGALAHGGGPEGGVSRLEFCNKTNTDLL